LPRRPKRKRILNEQLRILVQVFEETTKPTYDLREHLSQRLGMTNREVQVLALVGV
jgi:hypothetical protein